METLISTADLCDRFLGRPDGLQVVAPGLQSFGGRKAYRGRIATAAPGKPGGAVRLHDILAEPGNGRVLVVDGQAIERWAVLGDQLAALGQRHGWAGVVLNGYVRDVRALAGLDFGVHALGAVPLRPQEFDPTERDLPLSFRRTRFVPGSWLYADEDGIVVCVDFQPGDTRAHPCIQQPGPAS
ncbi:ribonuclease E activity regulator RraA [Massilia niastensis]|uniref:ribonuclease E activity regulator RraA n=1 Tax=Massilia niastensis TaxID=544911 RepID=UPI000364DEBA|nr:ribonuclease E activity regulator RraA [Massilia niastensis]